MAAPVQRASAASVFDGPASTPSPVSSSVPGAEVAVSSVVAAAQRPSAVPEAPPAASGAVAAPDVLSDKRQSFDPTPYVLADNGRSVVLGRYSTSSAQPPEDLTEPIDAVAALTFPRQTVHTIRQAIDFTLLRSGYRFDDGALSDAGRRFLDLPLPESQRQIGPYSVFTILGVLAGSAWRPLVNRVERTVSIALQPVYAYSAALKTPAVPAGLAVPVKAVKPVLSGVAGASAGQSAAPRLAAQAGDITP
jgi:type IV pili sensor histidine kinase/response regulator